MATLPLLEAVLDAVQVPVLAAGGIGTARGLAAVLAAGSAGAWVGTAFLACTEAATSPGARALLLAAAGTDTAYGRVFDVGQRLAWPPEYGGRALHNAFFDRWVGREEELAGDEVAVTSTRTRPGNPYLNGALGIAAGCVATQFPADRRRRPAEPPGDLPRADLALQHRTTSRSAIDK